jgi:GTP pyrophosphokinase
VLEAGGDEDMAIAALLHDVVEDCGGMPMLREVRKRFGPRVASMVEGCTDAFVEPKPPWRERKEKYLKKLRKASADTRMVSAADKVYNARAILLDYHDIGESVWDRFSGKKSGTLWYYRELVKEFDRANANRLGSELARVIAELERISMPAKRSSRQPKKTMRTGTQ